MELLKFSKFKLQLQALIAEARHLKERERSAAEQIHVLVQRQKQTEEEYSRNLRELQAELAASNELRQKLERQVSILQNDNALLENKQKELKETMHRILQCRESFLNAYEESTCDMKRSIEARDRKLSILSAKINSHLSLFDSIEREALSIKQIVDSVERLVSEKEEVVASLKSKMNNVSAFEKVFVEKIRLLEGKLRNDEDEFRRKDKIISELAEELGAAKVTNNCQTQIEELQKALQSKDMIIQNLISEKEALLLEVGSLGNVLQKIQEAVANMNQEDKKVFSEVLMLKEQCETGSPKDDYRIEDVVQNSGERSPTKASSIYVPENGASPLCQEFNSADSQLRENNNFNSCVSEVACSTPQSASSEPQSISNVLNNSVHDGKDYCRVLAHPLDSECSMIHAETSTDTGAET